MFVTFLKYLLPSWKSSFRVDDFVIRNGVRFILGKGYVFSLFCGNVSPEIDNFIVIVFSNTLRKNVSWLKSNNGSNAITILDLAQLAS